MKWQSYMFQALYIIQYHWEAISLLRLYPWTINNEQTQLSLHVDDVQFMWHKSCTVTFQMTKVPERTEKEDGEDVRMLVYTVCINEEVVSTVFVTVLLCFCVTVLKTGTAPAYPDILPSTVHLGNSTDFTHLHKISFLVTGRVIPPEKTVV